MFAELAFHHQKRRRQQNGAILLKQHVAYHDIGAQAYEHTQQEREMIYLKKKAAKLGFTLTPHEPVPIAGHV